MSNINNSNTTQTTTSQTNNGNSNGNTTTTANNNNNNNNNSSNNNIDDGNQLVCVKRSETSLATIFEDMYLNERLVDVTLTCNNGQLQAHKLVLAACSPYFNGLFDRLANPFHYPVIVIKDMLIEDLKLMVEFMYKGQLTLSQDKLANLVRNAECLQITGLSTLDANNIASVPDGTAVTVVTVEAPRVAQSAPAKSRRANRTVSSLLKHNQNIFDRNYHHHHHHHNHNNHNHNHNHIRSLPLTNHTSDPSPDKLLEQSMITGDSLDGGSSQQFIYATASSSSKNINHAQQLHHMPTTSLQLQHPMSMDVQQQLQQSHHNQISNQLQVLTHTLATNSRTSSLSSGQQGVSLNGQSTSNSGDNQSSVQQQQQQQQQSHQQQQPHRGRVHPCNICWKTFRERANLKRHLQVHSLDRVMYACLECNKTFSWKDNYIRHTKTAHHMNNARQQSS